MAMRTQKPGVSLQSLFPSPHTLSFQFLEQSPDERQKPMVSRDGVAYVPAQGAFQHAASLSLIAAGPGNSYLGAAFASSAVCLVGC